MMNTKIIAVIAAVVVVAAGIAAVVIMNNNNDDEYEVNETGRLLVFGNANNDDAIDSHDRDLVNDIVKGNTTWDKEINPYADANHDGSITEADVTQIQDIIDKKEGTTLWYREYYESLSNKDVSITYPMKTDRIGVYQYQAGILLNFLGLWNKVVYADNRTISSTQFFDTSKLSSYGDYAGSNMKTTAAVETFKASNVDVLVLNGYWDDTAVKDGLKAAGSDTQVIKPYSQGTYCLASMVTFGFILGAEEQAKEYIQFYEKATGYLNECFKNLSDSDKVSYLVPSDPKDSGKIEISSSGTNGTYPDLAWVLTLPGTNNMPTGDNGKYNAFRTAEWFTTDAAKSDYLIISISGLGTNSLQDKLDTYAEMFKETDEYKNKNILAFNYAYFNGCYCPGQIVLLASYLYPDLVDQEKAWELFDEFFDKYDINKAAGAKVYAGVYRMSGTA